MDTRKRLCPSKFSLNNTSHRRGSKLFLMFIAPSRIALAFTGVPRFNVTSAAQSHVHHYGQDQIYIIGTLCTTMCGILSVYLLLGVLMLQIKQYTSGGFLQRDSTNRSIVSIDTSALGQVHAAGGIEIFRADSSGQYWKSGRNILRGTQVTWTKQLLLKQLAVGIIPAKATTDPAQPVTIPDLITCEDKAEAWH
ncbi:hypothetical protein ASPBRDRAFT_33006 [Aspergillus brasiliensis CBS 101740]|uniref:Uncharacterized protein n=1 Tax=Aspergillus brasiliensis (strain CBS 101740 / IMI 381727 / IBT 21946) TaxID=767769 RepID=A0A1L9U9P1_ASPBC|nr:hypothetical protein ASPBRDRAFT_33006 [Aspergillus brasiliensis CBS 101740]